MTDLTSQSLCFRHIFLLTNFVVFFLICSNAFAAPAKDSSLAEIIHMQKCVFPPANITIPPKCSEWTLKSEVHDIEFLLCAALLDSTNRLCHLVTSDKNFSERVIKLLHEGLPNLVCDEMISSIDPNTTMVQAKEFYKRLRPRYCNAICFGIDDKENSVREPVCKSIQFAHEQIRAAIDLQASLNRQDKNRSPVGKDAVNTGNSKKEAETDESQISKDSKLPPKSKKEGNLDQPSAASQPKSGSVNSTSSSQTVGGSGSSKTGLDTSKPAETVSPKTNAGQVAEPALTQKSGSPVKSSELVKPKTPPQSSDLHDNSKEHHVAQDNKPSNNNGIQDAQGGIVGNSPVETEGQVDDPDQLSDLQSNPQIGQQLDPQTDAQSDPQADGQTYVQGEAPADVQGETQEQQNPSLAENDEGTDDNMRQFEEDDEIPQKVLDTNKDLALKSQFVDKKSFEGDALLPQKISLEHIGNFEEAEDSHFFAYFMTLSALCIIGYVVYHNKRKIIAMAVEGKKGRNTGRRRPNSASYHKLDSNLEEAMSSNLGSTNSYVIY